MLRDEMITALAADIPVLLWGAPGTGKSAAIMALAKERRAHVEVLIGSTLDPADIGGIHFPVDGDLRLAMPEWVGRLAHALDNGVSAWLFLDELSCAPSAVQAALLRVVHERCVGNTRLSGVRVVAAANPADSAADGGWLSPAMASRWLHLDWAPDPSEWVAGELGGWGLARGDAHAAASALVAAWIQRSPSALAPPATGTELRGHPSPRSWSAVASVLGASGSDVMAALKSRAGGNLIRGLVGAGAGGEFIAWAIAQDIADPEEILAGRARLPGRADKLSLALAGVAAAALADRPDRYARIGAAWECVSRARPDAAVMAARALANDPAPIPKAAMPLAERIRAAMGAIAA